MAYQIVLSHTCHLCVYECYVKSHLMYDFDTVESDFNSEIITLTQKWTEF